MSTPQVVHLQVNTRSPILCIIPANIITRMSKYILGREIQKELRRLNDQIDHKIVRGLPFKTESRRHRELLATLHRMDREGVSVKPVVRYFGRRASSPVRRSLAGGALKRIFGFGLA